MFSKLDFLKIKTIYNPRNPNSHKGNFGHALLVAGSSNIMGAAIIASKSCLRAGAGLLTLKVPEKEKKVIFSSIPEAMVAFEINDLDFSKYNAVAIGPGISTENKVEEMVNFVIKNAKTPIVLDADALNILSKNQNWLKNLFPNSVLTPHSKEFDRLFGNHNSEHDRRKTAVEKAKELEIIIVLKSHKTFITDGYQSFENSTGNSGLAKGGSGDALTGMIVAMMAQGYESLESSLLSVYLHGLAADITLETQSKESMLISDVIENIGKAFKIIEK